ncbi:MAG: bifunctional serine/threonine-protein kinase/formylglycine-generating enzyme family protein [Victivallales bacterium]
MEKTIKVHADAQKTMSAYAGADKEDPPVNFEDVKKSFKIANTVPSSHYSKVRTIGFGGVGLVVSGHDPNLDRDVAIKMLRAENKNKIAEVERFIREARATASIEHPNVIPVHEMGIMDGVGVFFSMKKVQGDNFQTVLDGFRHGKKEYTGKYTRHQLLELFINICNGVAYAHSKRIIHRDLKPHNVLIGDFGEVLVMDWGLAKFLDAVDGGGEPVVSQHKNEDKPITGDSSMTIDGTISGTPNYMPPEQAEGKISELDERSDIYSLGAILYQILAYEPPFSGDELQRVLEDVRKGNFIPPSRRFPKYRIPRELEAICLKAMSHDKSRRYQNVQELVADVRNYIEGFSVSACPDSAMAKFRKLCFRHPVISSTAAAAIFIVVAGYALLEASDLFQYGDMVGKADKDRDAGNSELRLATDKYRELDAVAAKRVFKEESPAEIKLSSQVNDHYMAAENRYESAVIRYTSVPRAYARDREVREGLMDIMFRRLQYSMLVKNYERAQKWIGFIHLWCGNSLEKLSPENRNTILTFEGVVKGDGYMTVRTNPPGSSVMMSKLVDNGDGILSETGQEDLGASPVKEFVIPRGSYILRIKTNGRPDVACPVAINHGEEESDEIWIPESIPEGMAYVPAGEFFIGGENSRYYRSHEMVIPGFFMKKHEVTFGEYLDFWKKLGTSGEKARHMAKIIFDFSERKYCDAWDDAGKLISPLKEELPVVGILHESAEAYCIWLSAKTGKEIMLPTAEQWEKAARGADGRAFPWGNGFNPEYAYIGENESARKKFGCWAPPGSFPEDVSVYGISDMGGNVREMTSSRFVDGGQFLQIKGASSSTTRRFLYCAYSSDTPVAPSDVGFRYVMPVEEKSSDVSR